MIPSTDYYNYHHQRRPSLPLPLPSATIALGSPFNIHHPAAIPNQQTHLLSPLPPISNSSSAVAAASSFQLPRFKLAYHTQDPITPPTKPITYPITPPSPQRNSSVGVSSFVLAPINSHYLSPSQAAPRSSALVSVHSLFNHQKSTGSSPKSKHSYYQSVFKYSKKDKSGGAMISRFPTTNIVKKQKHKPHKVNKPKPKSKQSSSIPSNTINYPITKVDINDHLNSIYASIEIKKYSTAAIDPFRPYLTVYEYSVNDNWIIWDYETGFVHLTGIWKASLNASTHQKADIVKLLESTPKQYQPYIKRIRGGFLKIQGTWLPYKLCRILARRFCYFIRFELIPLFGKDFPDYCLKPGERGFGELKLDEITDEQVLDLPKQNPLPVNIVNHISTPIKTTEILDHQFLPRPRPLPLPMETPDSSPKQHFSPNSDASNSSSTIASIFSNTHRTSSSSPNMSYTDMLDIVNASKCLQSIAQAQPYRGMCDVKSDDSSSDEETPNYTIKPIATPNLDITNAGIASSLLVAAGVLPNGKRDSMVSSLRTDIRKSPTVFRRGSMKINDLLS